MRIFLGCCALLAALGAVGGLESTNLSAQELPPREVFVPNVDLPSVLIKSEFAFLGRDEYEKLLADAKIAVERRPPVEHALLQADYRGKLEPGRVVIEGTIEIDVLADGLIRVPLSFSDVGILSAAIGDRPATLAIDPNLGPVVLLNGKGRHALRLVLTAPLATSAAQQTMQVRLPYVPSSKLTLTVPGNVEVKSGTPVVSRSVDDAGNTTTLELDVPNGPLAVVLSLNNKQLTKDRVIVARSVLIDELTRTYERLHAQMSFGVLQGALDTIEVRVPVGFEVTSVESPLVSRWSVADNILTIALHEPATETVVIKLTASRMGNVPEKWEFPQLVPREVASHASVVGLLLEDRLQTQTLAPTALSAIDATVLLSAAPPSVLAAGPGLPAIRPVVAFYAPHDLGRLSATFAVPEPVLQVATSVVATVSESELSARVGLSLLPKVEKRFSLDVSIPAGWQVLSTTASDGRPLTIERNPQEDGTTKLSATFAQGLPPDQAIDLLIDIKSIPKGWLDAWTENRLELPRVVIDDATVTEGAVSVAARDDLEIRPDTIEGLLPLTDAERRRFRLGDAKGTLAYRHLGAAPMAAFTVVRKTPSIVAQVYNFITLEPGMLRGRYEIRYEAREATVRKLSFSLPDGVPAEVALRGLDNVQVKDSTRATVNNRHQWEAILDQRTEGNIRLAVEFEMRLDEADLKNFALPLVRAEGVDYQRSYVAVEGHPELEVEIPQHPRKIDEGELYASDFRIGSRLVGTFGFAGEGEVRVNADRQKVHVLPAALVKQVRFRTQVSPSGLSQTESVYAIRSKAAFVEIELPAGATLWTITIDGKASKPQKVRDRLIVSLPPSNVQVERQLKIVYENAMSGALLAADLDIAAPILLTRETPESESMPVPVADAQWELVLPSGYEVRRSFGSVEETGRQPYVPAFWKLLEVFQGLNAKTAQSVSAVPASTVNGRPTLIQGLSGGAEQMADVTASEGTRGGRPNVTDPDFRKAMEETMRAGKDPNPPPSRSVEQASEDESQIARFDGAEARDEAPQDATKPKAASTEPNAANAQTPQQQLPPPAITTLQGVAGLLIGVEPVQASPRVLFNSLGEAPRIETTVVRRARLVALGIFVGLTILASAFWIGRISPSGAMWLVVGVMVLATVAPSALPRLETYGEVLDGAFFGAAVGGITLLIRHGLAAFWSGTAKVREKWAPRIAWFLGRTAVVWLVFATSAAMADPPVVVVDKAEVVPTPVPENVVIVPFDADDAEGIEKANTVWVPYAKYSEWLKAAQFRLHPEAAEPALPYGLSAAEYSAELGQEDRLDIKGKIEIEVFAKNAVSIPLMFSGGVMVEAKLDGASAKLQIAAPQPNALQQGKNAKALRPPPLMLLSGVSKGRHKFEFTYRLGTARQGGWRIASGALPVQNGSRLVLNAKQAATEVRLKGVADRELFETTAEANKIETSIAPPGSISISWRAKIDQALAERNVTVRSSAVFDVRQDVLRLSWNTTIEFPRSRRDQLSFAIPKDYVVERIVGDNVRAWQAKENDENKTVDVTLLSEAVDRETLTVYLARYGTVGRDAMSTFLVPAVQVTGASLQQGTIAVRRDTLLELRLLESRGVRREDAQLSPELAAKADSFDISPLPLREYQTYSYSAIPFTVRFGAGGTLDQSEVDTHALVSINERFCDFESRLTLTPKGRAVHRIDLELPSDLGDVDVDSPVEGGFEHSIVEIDGKRRLTMLLLKGQSSPFPVVITGKLPSPKNNELPIPRLAVENVARQEGSMAIEADAAYDVRIDPGANIEVVPASSTFGWIQGGRRDRIRSALHWRGNEYAGRVRLAARQPVVSSRILHNVRVTTQTLEQTIVADFQISNAGIREVSFLLPTELTKGRIRAPSARQVKITTPTEPALSSFVRVTIELEDEFLGDYRVQVLHDEILAGGAKTIRMPVLETGSLHRRYLILESAGRDEVTVANVQAMEPLTREQSAFVELTRILGPKITQAYVASEDKKDASLAISLQERETVETAGARIGMAETFVVLDQSGAYRAKQSYRVDNASEQYLEVVLPAGATLWTATVDGRPTKPAVSKSGTASNVRVPIIRRASGDADYEVALVYAGKLPPLTWSGTTRFPFPKTVNINVERSVVRLFLPEKYRWFSFDGMGRPVNEDEVQIQTQSYFQSELNRTLAAFSKGDAFAKTRAGNNMKQIELSLSNTFANNGDAYNSNALLNRSYSDNRKRIDEALKKAEGEEQVERDLPTFNRRALEDHVESQQLVRGKNQGDFDNKNFYSETERKSADGKESGFNPEWFKGNSIKPSSEVPNDAKELAPASRVGGATKKGKGDLAGKGQGQGERNDRNPLQQRLNLNQAGEAAPDKKNPESNEPDSQRQAISNYRDKLSRDNDITTRGFGGGRMLNGNQAPTNSQGDGVLIERMQAAGSESPQGRQPLLLSPTDGFSTADPSPAAYGLSALAGLSSLTIEIPQQGVEYRFAQTRNAESIDVRYADSTWIDRWQSAGLALLALVLALVAIRAGVWILSHPRVGCVAHILLFVLGFLLCVVGATLAGIVTLVVVTGNATRIGCERGWTPESAAATAR